jgi:hypothetical protein
VSAGGIFENAAYIDKNTGQIYFDTDAVDFEEEQPDNFEDGRIYIAIPHKNDLDLGRNLVYQYIEQYLSESSDTVRAFFRKKGAYSRFKDLLERKGRLEAWYVFEQQTVELALREWADRHDFQIIPD